MHARHYNPQIGRFLQVDPLAGVLSRPQSLNRYSYVLGNPVSLVDPKGLRAKDCATDGVEACQVIFGEEIDVYADAPYIPLGSAPTINILTPGLPGWFWSYNGNGGNQGGGSGGDDSGFGGGGNGDNVGGDTPTGEDPPNKDPEKKDECAQLSPAQQRYLNSWSTGNDSQLQSMLAQVGNDGQMVFGHMRAAASMYLLGAGGASALGYGLQIAPSAPVSLIVGDSSGLWASRLGQFLFRPGSYLNGGSNFARSFRMGISQNTTSWLFRVAGAKVARWAKPNGHMLEKVICPK
jgi:hypothetical protein